MTENSIFYNNLEKLENANKESNPVEYLNQFSLNFSNLRESFNNADTIPSTDSYKFFNLLYTIFPMVINNNNDKKIR